MDTIREQIYLAALLHDIGKFYQRADTGSVSTSEHLSDYNKKVESTFCPLGKYGTYTHKHVLWTAQFIDDYRIVFEKLLNTGQTLTEMAACHHLSYAQLSSYGKIIKESDCLSSGMDRDSDIAFKDEQDSIKDWDSFKKKSMISLLETIHLSDAQIERKDKWHHIPVKEISLDESCFPTLNSQIPDYKSLWEKFIYEFKFIQADTYRAFAETFLNLLFKYTSSIPASTINFPDVSLYDHLKTTAAISVCLYDYIKSGETSPNPFLLIGADLSGIQTYIYEIVSKYAGKNLKGRSFYLRLLSDSIVRHLLKQLHLFKANVIYNSGGGFYILAPNTPETRTALQESIGLIEEQLFQTHGTILSVAIDSIEVSREDLLHKGDNNLGKIWGQLFSKRDSIKSRKYSAIIRQNYDRFFNPSMVGGDTERDIITGEEFAIGEPHFSENDLSPLKKISKEQLELGKALRETDVMVVAEEDIPYWKDRIHINPIGLGFTYYFIRKDELEKMKKELRSSADKVTVVTLNGDYGDCNFMREITVDGINNIYALEFYGGNEADMHEFPTFEEMCQRESEDAFKRLGVLRMDVDNLGYIFQKGISPKRATLSRFAALSRSFDFFFSGYLNTIWREVAPKQTFIIYSGGDDVFIVGSWDKTIQIAERIKQDFQKHTCYNPVFTISGGIAILSSKYPIMKGADESAAEEKKAKEHTVGNSSKNSISFMNTPLNWDKEFSQVKALKDSILTSLRNESLPKSFISKIQTHAINAEIKNHVFSTKGIKTYWMLAYDLSRMQNRNAKHTLLERCKTEVCTNKQELNGVNIETNYHPLELWAFACRWAELEYRSE